MWDFRNRPEDGSVSKDLSYRINSYFQHSNLTRHLTTNQESLICRALLKYGVHNFRLYILEVVPDYNDDVLSNRERLSYLEGYWVGILKTVYNCAGTGIGFTHNANSALKRANRIVTAKKYKRTTFIDCYDYGTNEYLFTYEGVRALARELNKTSGTIRHHLNKGSKIVRTASASVRSPARTRRAEAGVWSARKARVLAGLRAGHWLS